MSDDWEDCERPWTIDEFLGGRQPAPVEWSTKQPEEEGHYWIYRPETLYLDVVEIADGDVFLGDRLMSGAYSPHNPWRYGPRISPPGAPK